MNQWFGPSNESPALWRILLLWPLFLLIAGPLLLWDLLSQDWQRWRGRHWKPPVRP